MNLHQISGRRTLGLLLALCTAATWGSLPIALKVLLDTLDAATITWARFLLAAPLLPRLITADELSLISVLGALLVVVGSMLTAVGRRRNS